MDARESVSSDIYIDKIGDLSEGGHVTKRGNATTLLKQVRMKNKPVGWDFCTYER